jgi:regulatory protein
MRTRNKTKIDYEATYQRAIRLLTRRAHSRDELAQKLRQHGASEQIIDQVMVRCEERRYIDDAAACDSYCRELIRKGFGPRMIRQRLSGRGIAGELIQSALEILYPHDVVLATARAVATRKSQQLGSRFRKKFEIRMRLARYLTQRGFPSGIIHDILDDPLDDNSI